jgi:hypothetical protein
VEIYWYRVRGEIHCLVILHISLYCLVYRSHCFLLRYYTGFLKTARYIPVHTDSNSTTVATTDMTVTEQWRRIVNGIIHIYVTHIHIRGIFIFRMWRQNGVIWNFDMTEHPRPVLHALWYSQYVQSPHGKAKYHHTAVGVEHYGGWYLDLQWTGDITALHDTTGS